MTRFLFVQSEFENIGIEYLSAGLKQSGHEVELLFLASILDLNKNNSDIGKEIQILQPDIIAFSPFSMQYNWALKRARFIKKYFPKVFILFGGVHVNSVPDSVITRKWIDGIIVGEADETIVEFANNYKGDYSKCRSFWYKKRTGEVVKNKMAPLVVDLDKLPFPDKDLFYEKMPEDMRKLPYTVMGSRGCPFACSYCSNNIYQRLYAGQKRLRYRSPDLVVEEIVVAKKKYPFNRVDFSDDVLAVDMVRLKTLTNLYKKKVNLPFSCFFHPQLVSIKTIKALRKGGCDWMKLGIQSANEEYRHKYLNRHETNKQVLLVAKLCRKYGLNFSFDHIFNLPGETKSHLIEAVKFYNLCRPNTINFGGLMYLPATDIIKFGLDFKEIRKEDLPKITQGTHMYSKQTNVPWYFYKQRGDVINPSIFMMLFILITLLPKGVIDMLIWLKVYNWPFLIPNWIIIPLKIMSKIRGGQIYLYVDRLKQVIANRINYRPIS